MAGITQAAVSREQLASFLQRESEWEAARRQKVARAQREEQSYCDEMQRDTVRCAGVSHLVLGSWVGVRSPFSPFLIPNRVPHGSP